MSDIHQPLWLLLPGERPSPKQYPTAQSQHWISPPPRSGGKGATLLVFGTSDEVIGDPAFPGEYITRLELITAPAFRAALNRLRNEKVVFAEHPHWSGSVSHTLASVGAAWMRQAHRVSAGRRQGARVRVPYPSGTDTQEARERCMEEFLEFLRNTARDNFDTSVLIGGGGSPALLAQVLGELSHRWEHAFSIRNQLSEALELMLGGNELAQERALGALRIWPTDGLESMCRTIGHSYVISPELRERVVEAGCENPHLSESDLAALGSLVSTQAGARRVLDHPRCSPASVFSVSQALRGGGSEIPVIALARAAMVRGRSNAEWIAAIAALSAAAAEHGLGLAELANLHKQLGNEIEGLSSSELIALSVAALRESRVS